MIRHALFLFLTALSSAVGAVDFGEERGGWTIVAVDGACGMSMEFEGPGATSVIVLDSLDKGVVVGVGNYQWSSKKDEKYEVDFALNGTSYGGGTAFGASVDGRPGFMVGMESEFLRDFAAGQTLHVYLKGEIIDRLSLDGTSIAVASLKRCMALQMRERSAAAREKAKYADLPNDPFAAPSDSTAGQGTPPKPIGNIGYWASSADYPSSALRAEAKGVTRFALAVGKDGVVQSCEVTATSGNDDLDATTCTVMMRRARFSPAQDANGVAVEGRWQSSVRWDIPEPPPPPPAPITCVAGKICTRSE